MTKNSKGKIVENKQREDSFDALERIVLTGLEGASIETKTEEGEPYDESLLIDIAIKNMKKMNKIAEKFEELGSDAGMALFRVYKKEGTAGLGRIMEKRGVSRSLVIALVVYAAKGVSI